MLPGWLRQALEYVGYEWPASDESVLFAWAGDWRALGADCSALAADIERGIRRVEAENRGRAADNFGSYMHGADGNLQSLLDFQQATGRVAVANDIAGGIVLALKIAVMAQLAILAYAIAAAVATAGLASAGVVAARQAAKWAIEAAINIAVEKLLAG